MLYDLMWILCIYYSYIMMVNITTQIKSSLIREHNFIQLIISVFHFVKRFTTKCHMVV